jgi:hypothetical protein
MNRIVPKVPAATPNFSCRTEPITALVLGDENKPNPTPTTTSLKTISNHDDTAFNSENNNNPTLTMPIPNVDNTLDPNRSESQPHNGESKAIGAAGAIRNKPAVCGSRPLILSK